MSERRYFPELTIARGLIALLVIVGHAFPDGDGHMADPLAWGIHGFIYAFHMGAFIFIAGFVAAPRLLSGGGRGSIRRRFERLMIPYLCWTALLLALKQIFGALARQPFSPGEAWKLLFGLEHLGWLWFLWTLFVITCAYSLWLKRFKNPLSLVILCAALSMTVQPMVALGHLPDGPLARAGKYAVFYGLGLMARPRADAFFRLCERPAVAAAGFLLPLIGLWIPMPYLIEGLAGIALTVFLARRIDRRGGRLRAFWHELGERSYDIYLLGYYVQTPLRVLLDRGLHAPYWAQVIPCAVLGLLIPLWLSRHLIPKTGAFRRWFLGHAD